MIYPQSDLSWRIGTIGFSYTDWRSNFYPKGTKAADYLSYYSRIFNAVEIDSTFHAIPRVEILQRWIGITPDDFRFAVKMPRQITHQPGLTGQRSLLEEFLQVVRSLGSKLGPILIQFPPSFRASQINILSEFLSDLPRDLRFAVEVRHQSWYTRNADGEPALAVLLRKFGICWTAIDYPRLPAEIWKTSDFAYFRWIGQNGSFAHHTQERIDRTEVLTAWKALIEQKTDSFDEIFGFFNNDYAGFAPGTANRFKRLLDLPVIDNEPPVQGTLF